jgi:hypothetical protein
MLYWSIVQYTVQCNSIGVYYNTATWRAFGRRRAKGESRARRNYHYTNTLPLYYYTTIRRLYYSTISILLLYYNYTTAIPYSTLPQYYYTNIRLLYYDFYTSTRRLLHYTTDML